MFYRRGVIESWGRGTIKIAELTERAGLPRPAIDEVAGCVIVRFSPTRYVPPQRVAQNVTERQQRVLATLSTTQGGMALREIRLKLRAEFTDRQIRKDLEALRVLGLAQSSRSWHGSALEIVLMTHPVSKLGAY